MKDTIIQSYLDIVNCQERSEFLHSIDYEIDVKIFLLQIENTSEQRGFTSMFTISRFDCISTGILDKPQNI